MAVFNSILYLDDVRVPTLAGISLVRNYAEFVEYLDKRGMPDLISFDRAGEKVPYSTYKEQTGLHCARFIIENRLPLRHWAVHSCNVQGRINMERELRRYCRRGEVRGLQIPFAIEQTDETEAREEVVADPRRSRFSSTSLLQFEEEIALESWERALSGSVVRG
jgi:hypothetical protein